MPVRFPTALPLQRLASQCFVPSLIAPASRPLDFGYVQIALAVEIAAEDPSDFPRVEPVALRVGAAPDHPGAAGTHRAVSVVAATIPAQSAVGDVCAATGAAAAETLTLVDFDQSTWDQEAGGALAYTAFAALAVAKGRSHSSSLRCELESGKDCPDAVPAPNESSLVAPAGFGPVKVAMALAVPSAKRRSHSAYSQSELAPGKDCSDAVQPSLPGPVDSDTVQEAMAFAVAADDCSVSARVPTVAVGAAVAQDYPGAGRVQCAAPTVTVAVPVRAAAADVFVATGAAAAARSVREYSGAGAISTAAEAVPEAVALAPLAAAVDGTRPSVAAAARVAACANFLAADVVAAVQAIAPVHAELPADLTRRHVLLVSLAVPKTAIVAGIFAGVPVPEAAVAAAAIAARAAFVAAGRRAVVARDAAVVRSAVGRAAGDGGPA